MDSTRRTAVVTGVFFLVAAFAAVAAKLLWQPVLSDDAYVLGAGSADRVALGGWFEFLLAVSCIGTAVGVYPVVSRHGPGLALGYVGGRILEAATIVVGLAAVLSVEALRQAAPRTDGEVLVTAQRALIAVHDQMFLLGPGLVIGVNSLLLAWLMHRSGLVPRWIAVLGLVGGPLVLVSSTAVLFGLYEQVSVVAGLAALPVAAWEMCLAGYLIAKGFRPVVVRATPLTPRPLAPATV